MTMAYEHKTKTCVWMRHEERQRWGKMEKEDEEVKRTRSIVDNDGQKESKDGWTRTFLPSFLLFPLFVMKE